MAIKIVNLKNDNLLNLSYWTVGTGGCILFNPNGVDAEQQRLFDTNPYGQSKLVWQTNPNSDGGASGGWESLYVPIDNTKTYRFSMWVRRTSGSTGGTFYHGLHTNGSGDTYHIYDNGSNTNPYWCTWGIGQFNQNQWYLVVGHLFPNNYTGWAHPDSGIYTREGGKVIFLNGSGAYDFKMGSGASKVMHRAYHYYTSNTADHLQFYSPRIEALEEYCPSVDALLNVDLTDPTSKALGIVLPNGSIKTSASPIEGGKLISVQSFTSSGTWTKPANCNTIVVQMVGGGGGAAYHQESGGGGGFTEKLINVSGVSTVPVTIGGGGSRVGYYAAAGDGGTSSFGSYCSASGGYGANRNYSHSGGHGGIGSGGDINLYGGSGTGHGSSGNNNIGRGGETFFGGSRGTSHSSDIANIYTAGYGTGGPGGGGGGRTGSDGMPGLITVYSYK